MCKSWIYLLSFDRLFWRSRIPACTTGKKDVRMRSGVPTLKEHLSDGTSPMRSRYIKSSSAESTDTEVTTMSPTSHLEVPRMKPSVSSLGSATWAVQPCGGRVGSEGRQGVG
eukprot:g3046.t1